MHEGQSWSGNEPNKVRWNQCSSSRLITFNLSIIIIHILTIDMVCKSESRLVIFEIMSCGQPHPLTRKRVSWSWVISWMCIHSQQYWFENIHYMLAWCGGSFIVLYEHLDDMALFNWLVQNTHHWLAQPRNHSTVTRPFSLWQGTGLARGDSLRVQTLSTLFCFTFGKARGQPSAFVCSN